MTLAEYFLLGLFLFLGLLALLAAGLNMEWFFQTRQTAQVINMLGRTGARIFYGLLGLALIGCSIMGWLSWRP